jgi:pyruvate,orthophosphate dikinase
MMRTIKNVGLNERIVEALYGSGSADFVRSTCATLLADFAPSALAGEPDDAGNAAARSCASLPQDPRQQLRVAIRAVFESWRGRSVRDACERLGIPPDLGTAVVVQMMVFGNRDGRSGSGVVHTREPQTGDGTLAGDFALTAQGDAVVSGQRAIRPESWRDVQEMPGVLADLERFCRRLERELGWAQDVEFTVESGRLWMLQARKANLAPLAVVRCAVDLLEEGVIGSRREALAHAIPMLPALSTKQFDPRSIDDARRLGVGVDTVAGAVSGFVVVAPADDGSARARDERVEQACRALWSEGKPVVLVSDEMDPDLVPALKYVDGIVARRGGKNCHLAIVARKMRLPTITGCDGLIVGNSWADFDGVRVAQHEPISMDGGTGRVYRGTLETVACSRASPERDVVARWMDELDYRLPWAVAAHLGLSAAEVDGIRSTIPRSVEDLPWQTEKARVIELLVRAFPRESRIGMTVVAAHDADRLLQELLRSVDEGFEPGVRSCFTGESPFGKAPWEMGLTEDLARAFVAGRPDYAEKRRCKPDGDWGPYPEWVAPGSSITELVVMDNPPGLGLRKEASRERHFVFNVQCNACKNTVVVELLLKTDQLRDIERLEQDRAIYVTLHLDQDRPEGKRALHYRFGADHVTAGEQPSPLEFWEHDSERCCEMLSPKAWRVARWVGKRVFGEWWSLPVALSYRLMFLSRHGLDVLEAQGRCDLEGNVEYALIYDCKGREEGRVSRGGV